MMIFKVEVTMKAFILVILLATLSACSSSPKRNRLSDKGMRVMVDPDTIDSQNHVRIANALVESGKWYVVDRSKGFKAAKKEQERLHRTEADRYEPKQKYAHYGKLYGVGSIVVAHVQCSRNNSNSNILVGLANLATLGIFHRNHVCSQFLELIDTNTGEVIVSTEHSLKTDEPNNLRWEKVVAKFNERYPSHFIKDKKHEILEEYEEISGEESQRQAERVE